MKFQIVSFGQSNMVRNESNLEGSLKRNYGDVVLSRCAVNGSSIDEWMPGTPNYVNAVNKVKANQALGYPIKGLFMMHGERNARGLMPRAEYTQKTMYVIAHLHADIGYPWMPVIYGQLGKVPVSGFDANGWEQIRLAQWDMMTKNPAYHMFQTATLGPYVDDPSACHYYDNMVDPTWPGTGYKEIVYNFITRFKALLPPVQGVINE